MESYVLEDFEKFLKLFLLGFQKNIKWKPCNWGNNLRKKIEGGFWHSQKRRCE